MITILSFLAYIGRWGYNEAIVENFGRPGMGDYFMVGLIGLVGFLVGVLAAGVIGLIGKKKVEKEEKTLIASLRTESTTSGSFFLGIGSIESDTCYFYYAKIDGHYELKNIKTKECEIHEDDKEPHIQTYTNNFVNQWWWLFAVPFFLEPKSRIHIPKGSIIHEFKP